jgi:hypothetical protein
VDLNNIFKFNLSAGEATAAGAASTGAAAAA